MSDQSHSAQVRAAMIVGVRPEGIRKVATDGDFRLDMTALARAVAEDRAAGFQPIAICANAGAPSTGAIDPLQAMADYCRAEGIWLHVDAAYGGFATITEKGSEALSGIERADSIGLDPHKWLFQPYDVGCLLVKDARTLESVFAFGTTVLQDTIWGANHPNINDRGLQLSRSFRALKIWMSIQTFGMSAFRRAVSKRMELAARADEYIRQSPVLELLTPASLGVVCMRVNPEGAGVEDETLMRSTGKSLPAFSGMIARSFRRRLSIGPSPSGSASSTTRLPGTMCGKRWRRWSGSAAMRWRPDCRSAIAGERIAGMRGRRSC